MNAYYNLVEFYEYANANAGIWLAEPLHTISHYSSPLKYWVSLILIGLNWSCDAIVFIHGEALTAHNACLQKIPGRIVVHVVRENFSVNKLGL